MSWIVEVGRNKRSVKRSVSGVRRLAGNGRRCGLIPAYGLPLRKGQKVEIAILAVDEDEELEQLRADLAMRGVTEVLPNQLAD